MKKETYNDEIHISDIILNLWDNKIKVLIITITFLILGYLYYSASNKNYIATTNIKPISTFENQKYATYNAFAGKNGININSDNLHDSFINKIQTTEIIEEGIIKFGLIDKDKFPNKEKYNQAIKRNAIMIIDQMISPLKDQTGTTEKIPFWQYKFLVNDKVMWIDFLKYIEKKANEEIRVSLINRFNVQINILNNKSKFQLEDIDQTIANTLDDYKTEISYRLEFLKEQAEIARTLDIAKNTLVSENFRTKTSFVTNIKSENEYYFKGYEMIEKEINLINSRKNEKAFIKDLLRLEKNKRTILQNKTNERIKLSFSETPVYNKSKFIAGKIDYHATVYNSGQSLVKTLGLSLVIGLLISFMYILFNNVITSRK